MPATAVVNRSPTDVDINRPSVTVPNRSGAEFEMNASLSELVPASPQRYFGRIYIR